MFGSHVLNLPTKQIVPAESAGAVVTYEKQSKVNMFICVSNASLWHIDLSL